MEDVPEHFQNLLRKIAQEQNFVHYDLNIKPVSSGGANYTSKLYSVTITEGSNVLNIFAKIAAIGEKMRSQGLKIYDVERFAYTELAKTYEELQQEHEVPDNLKLFFPKFYGSNPKNLEETIVLENLVASGYMAYDRLKSVDWPYARSAIEELTKMHALSFAYQKYHPEVFNGIIEKVNFEWNPDEPEMKSHFEKVTRRAIELIRKENKEKLKRFFETYSPHDFASMFKASRRQVLAHGDYRLSNLMHKKLDNGQLDIKIVDLQTLQGKSPVIDLLFFIMVGSDEQFRAQYYDKLVDHYYTQLSAAMTRLHLNPDEIYSKEDFEFELKEKLPCSLTLAIFTLPVVTVDPENAPKVNEDLQLSSFSVDKTSDLYTERLNGLINDYVKWGVLK